MRDAGSPPGTLDYRVAGFQVSGFLFRVSGLGF